ncbi:MAG: hypothetical protein EXQ55_01585 [Acidobacteria bacterium]|nr:hypothetical protein [Acidobacteriota bacterium]
MGGSVKYLPSVFFCLVVLGISIPAAAQDVPMIELSGGYKFLSSTIPPRTDSTSFSNGWYVDLGINTPNPRKMLAVVGQVGMSRKTIAGQEASIREFMGGVRLNSRAVQRTVLFVQFLAGGTNSKFGNAGDGFDEWTMFYTAQYGGGVSLMVGEKASIRLGADYLQVHGKVDSTILNKGFNMVRVSAGIVLPFGTR